MVVGLGFVAALGVAAATRKLTAPDVRPPRMHSGDDWITEYGGARLESELRTLCGQCHAFPSPKLLPAYRWVGEIDRALGFHEESGDKSLTLPDSRLILAWFKKHAKFPSVPTGELEEDVSTVLGHYETGPTHNSFAATAGLLPTGSTSSRRILFSDMISGYIRESSWPDTTTYKILYRGSNPARMRACNLSDEVEYEYLISDLGTPSVTDDLCGKVSWMKWEDGEVTVTDICNGLGRVADAQSGDLDGDGDEDVVIAEFGWRKTGSIVLLENLGDGEFRRSTLDDRHGPVEVEFADMDADGRLDIVAIFGQEFESVELYQNTGDLRFDRKRLYRSRYPTFGMSSLTLADTDSDGDPDIVFSSGDMYDSMEVQDHHGLYLLSNDGNGEFVAELIGNQTAIMSSTAGDVDGDGDIDLVAGSFIPAYSAHSRSNAYPAVVLYEQLEAGEWRQRVLKSGDCSQASVELTDLDADGDLDLVAGVLHDAGGPPEPAWVFWRNQSRPDSNHASVRGPCH